MTTIAMPEPDYGILRRRREILAELENAVPGILISDPAETLAYECDALTAYRCPPLAVALPRTTEEVANILATCKRLHVPVVPRGAGTSLAGGSLPTADSVILGTARMNRVLDIDIANRCVTVQTGVTNLSVSGAVADDGFFYAPDPSSQLACAIAGTRP
ncbi:FAD-binding protein [Rhodobacterales bacterium FZCC0188]|jgi:glycolate oxidase|nr:FAD-binding protein [Rhodobacterales bacterium FZCC0188]